MVEFVVFSFILRFFSINQSLWLDEAIGAIAARDYSYWEIITVFLRNDNHPPLFYLLLKAWSSVFGYSDVALRLLNVFVGALTVGLVFLLLKKFQPKIARIATLFVATSAFLIYYSHEVRMYMITVLFAVCAMYAFLHTFEKSPKRMYWIVFSISICALLFSDYVPVFLLPVFALYAYFKNAKRQWWMYFLMSFIPLVALGILWLPILVVQIQGGAGVLSVLPEWKNVAGGATFKQASLVWTKFVLGRISPYPQVLYRSLLVVCSIVPAASLLLSLRKCKQNSFIFFTWLWLCIPLFLCFIASFFFPAFVYFRFTFVAPAFFILIAHGISTIKSEIIRVICICTVLAAAGIGLLFYFRDETQQREAWRNAVLFVENNAQQNSIALFEFPEAFAPYRWYSKEVIPAVGALSEIKAQEGDSERLKTKLDRVKNVYYFNYLQDLTDPQNIARKTLQSEGFVVKQEVGDYPGVGIITIWQRN